MVLIALMANGLDLKRRVFDGDVEVRGRGGADQIIVAETFAGRSVLVEDGPELDQVFVNTNGVGTASIAFDSSADLALLTIGNGGSATLLAGGNRVLNTQALVMQTGAGLDLTDNYLILDYTGASPLTSVRAAPRPSSRSRRTSRAGRSGGRRGSCRPAARGARA